jgi:hypothetical protein
LFLDGKESIPIRFEAFGVFPLHLVMDRHPIGYAGAGDWFHAAEVIYDL